MLVMLFSVIFFFSVRLILFAIVWAISFGKISFWLLPNLTEDVGFFDSFRPLYKYDVYSSAATAESVQQKSEGNDADEKNGDEQAETIKCDDDMPRENVAGGTGGENENVDEDEEDDNDDVDVVEGDDVQLDEEDDDNEDDEGRKSGSSSNDNGYEMLALSTMI
jgi:translocation protein SEC62